MEYLFNDIEKKWQDWWVSNKTYRVSNPSKEGTAAMRPKCYILDMFPYPSGKGLHVGHPLGYIASDIYSRYKRLKGFNVLHPMGYDAFGLPAEQYAIDHGIHPAVSTAANIQNFRGQLEKLGFSFDWEREVNTSNPSYYKWTQWIFLQLFDSWYDRASQKARRLKDLIDIFTKEGNGKHSCPGDQSILFSSDEWKMFDPQKQMEILMHYRLAYCGFGEVNWCEGLGTVLANDEVINGVSERGGYPVVRKRLRQWYLRITEYADRLLQGLEKVEYSEAMKEMQGNWIGKSSGAEIDFQLATGANEPKNEENYRPVLRVYTTRPDTIFGVDFMVIAPEHELVETIISAQQKAAVEEYIAYVKSRSERERMAEKKISGIFTGAYAIHPFSKKKIPIWISEYVLAGYGTGAIMAVPCGDERDHKFAIHFGIPITNIIGSYYANETPNATKEAILENSDFLDGMVMKDAIEVVIKKLEALRIGIRKINYKMRDAAFSRQRYWGEPFPIKWIDGVALPLDESELPLELPEVDSYRPGPDGEGPLANLPEWFNETHRVSVKPGFPSIADSNGQLETNTMPGYAGSSWYFFRYMDPHNETEFCERRLSDYWGQVDLYIGGTEHAVGHLLYSRLWTKVLYDLGYIGFDEPYKKLLNQGMIQGSSRFAYRLALHYEILDNSGHVLSADHDPSHTMPLVFASKNIADRISRDGLNAEEQKTLCEKYFQLNGVRARIKETAINPLHVDVNMVDGVELDIGEFKKWRNDEYEDAAFYLEDGKYICGAEVEKMSKSKFNTVNPVDLVLKYGADTFRMYEMFLGPVEMSKPWDTKGIEGVHRFLKKFWRLFFDEEKGSVVTRETASPSELKVLHRAIKKIEEDTERFSFNTTISAFMIATNELSELKCHKASILEPLVIILAPFAPHISEELYHHLNAENKNTGSIFDTAFPDYDEQYLVETSKEYPVSINGKLRTSIQISLDAPQIEVEKIVLANSVIQKWLEGKAPKKIIYVKNKMVNVVI